VYCFCISSFHLSIALVVYFLLLFVLVHEKLSNIISLV